MIRNLTLIHRKTGSSAFSHGENPPDGAGAVIWETCLRQIALGGSDAMRAIVPEADDEIYTDEKAYAFLLEVICGLHSKILGENEIVGQFKHRFLQSAVDPRFKAEFDRLPQMLLTDMKRVRAKFPLNLGNHSYGSYVRRVLAERSRKRPAGPLEITMIGTGELAKVILPWIANPVAPVKVFYRSDSGRVAFTESDEVRAVASAKPGSFAFSTSTGLGDVLILAAPVTAAGVMRHFGANAETGAKTPSLIFDFRADCRTDVLRVPAELIDLHDFFAQARSVDEASAERRKKACLLIQGFSEDRLDGESMQIRTQGWEDLCG